MSSEPSEPSELTRRDLLEAAAAAVTASAALVAMPKMPTIYLPHGGGPWPWVPHMAAASASLARYLEGLAAQLPPAKAILCITAHWEASRPTVSSHARPPMLYDYAGFPPETYELVWPAPGEPGLAQRVRGLLEDAGIPAAEDSQRGFDHGTFVPLAVAWPKAEIPTVQLSLVKGLDPETHLAIGRALAPLRDEGVLIVGSGMSYHNMRGFFGGNAREHSARFDAWLADAIAKDPAARAEALRAWSHAPSARDSHPREEHLLPLMVVTGAAGDDAGTVAYRGDVLGARVSAVHYG